MAETVKHTEGPWLVEDYSENGVPKFFVVPHTYFGTVAECAKLEDAKLIAAAPDMLEALQIALNLIQNTESEFGIDLETGKVVRAAIAKATEATP